MRARYSVITVNAFDHCASGVDDHCDQNQNAERRRLLRSKCVFLQCNCNANTVLPDLRSDFILDVTTILVRTVST